jgi:hypothetical protein
MALAAERIIKQHVISLTATRLRSKSEGVVKEHCAQTRRPFVLGILQNALASGRANQRLDENPSQGYRASAEDRRFWSIKLCACYDYVTVHVYPAPNRSASEHLGFSRGSWSVKWLPRVASTSLFCDPIQAKFVD